MAWLLPRISRDRLRRRLRSGRRRSVAGRGPVAPPRARGGLRIRRAALGVVVVLLLPGLAGAAPAESSSGPGAAAPGWRWLGELSGRAETGAAVVEGPSGEIAIGDVGGATWWRGTRRDRAALPAVSDLAFDAAGGLVLATDSGLHLWPRDGRPLRRTLRDGEAANRIHRLAVVGSSLVLATDAGAYWSADARVFQPLRVAGATLPVTRVAVVPPTSPADGGVVGPAVVELWLFGAGHLARVRGVVSGSGLRVIEARRETLPDVLGERVPVDLVYDPGRRALHLVFEDAIATRDPEQTRDLAPLASPWRIRRPVLPPGAIVRRLAVVGSQVLLATDSGLLRGSDPMGPFARVTSPAGTSDCVDVRSGQGLEALALCREGVFALAAERPREVRGFAPAPGPSGVADVLETLPPDPPVHEILRRALERAGLDVEADRRLERGLWRRAFWPTLALRFGADLEQDRARDSDQAFVSGDTRHLLDRRRDDGRRLSASLTLDWDLGGVAFPEDAVDLSRERRQVVSLRDDVADEINQLYFERQSIRERLATPGAVADPEEGARLRWRARELEAGLDAWTGGFIARWRARNAGRGDRPEDTAARRRFALRTAGAARDPGLRAPSGAVAGPEPGIHPEVPLERIDPR